MDIQAKLLKTVYEKSRGLIGYTDIFPVCIKTRLGIHTFGMKSSLDVLILDRKGKIVKIAEQLKPNRILLWPLRYDTVVELPHGDIKKRKLKIGDTVHLILT